MQKDKLLKLTTFTLSFAAGYCDTSTFVAADRIFSAHITGNFIILAYNLIFQPQIRFWTKLLGFPVFLIAVFTGSWITKRSVRAYNVIFIEAIILLAAGVISFFAGPSTGLADKFVVMLIVFGMGLQNAFGRAFPGELFGPSTMMTSNVDQLGLEVGSLMNYRYRDHKVTKNIFKLLFLIASFFIGCVCGGIISKQIGLTAVLLPSVLLISLSIYRNHFLA